MPHSSPLLAAAKCLLAGLLTVAFSAGAQTAARKTYIVQLADAPTATYTGGISGLAATRPSPGVPLNFRAANVRAYVTYLDSRRASALARAGNPAVMHRYNVAFNGFAAQLTDAQVKALRSGAGVVSVIESKLRHLDTNHTPAFLGLSGSGGVWSKLDASSRAVQGEDVIIGMLDSGIWPENPSFGDKVDANGKPVAYSQPGTSVYGPPPAKWKGTCQTGEGFTAAMCNNKLIGARWYGDAFIAGAPLSTFEFKSPRDAGFVSAAEGGGHGSHTSSTAGGNANVEAAVNGIPIGSISAAGGAISGVAPRARIATYKVCWEAKPPAAAGCAEADILKAIDDAVKDGVDVINFSIGSTGPSKDFLDPTEIAFFNAAAANVFVAASAGNAGPANTLDHISPWLTTVGASTHRSLLGQATLGSGTVLTGASVNNVAVNNAPLVLASDIPAASASSADANLCLANTLDAVKAAGKIVVCDRGNNARVDKSAEVKRAGGVGMIMTNPSVNDTVADFHSVPTVHLSVTDRAPLRSYATSAGAAATASISVAFDLANPVVPVMASFSSRGPNQGSLNILKPDVTGPGVDVFAAWVDTTLTQQQHDDLALNNFLPKANANLISGTSMSSPHVAGAAALLKQLYPSWSPSAIKSALMTSATDVLLADGTRDGDRWGYGAGHLNPRGSINPGLVYDATTADYGRFLCGLGLTPPAGAGSCASLGSVPAYNLNLASLTAAEVAGTSTLTRAVRNVTGATATFVSSYSLPGWDVVVSPSSLTLAPDAVGTFTVKLTRVSAAVGGWTFGNLNWTDGIRTVRSPLSARALGFIAPTQISDVRTTGMGTKVFSITSSYDGALAASSVGMVPALVSNGLVANNETQCFDVTVAAGAQLARFQLFNADTLGGSATDIDLEVFNGPGGTGTSVGSSGSSTSDEAVTLRSPDAGTYSACVTGYTTPAGGASFKLSAWVVGPQTGAPTLRVSLPAAVYAGGAASVGLRWNVPAGARYLGNVRYLDGSSNVLGSTIIFIDNH